MFCHKYHHKNYQRDYLKTMLNVAIVGTGPYGLSVAAHFRQHRISFRIFGRPMDSWVSHMPKGMMLKSDGFASDIYDPNRDFTLKHFCAERGIEYADSGIPVRLDTFAAYGLAFGRRMVPELEDRMVVVCGSRMVRQFRPGRWCSPSVLPISNTFPLSWPSCRRSSCRIATSIM